MDIRSYLNLMIIIKIKHFFFFFFRDNLLDIVVGSSSDLMTSADIILDINRIPCHRFILFSAARGRSYHPENPRDDHRNPQPPDGGGELRPCSVPAPRDSRQRQAGDQHGVLDMVLTAVCSHRKTPAACIIPYRFPF